MVKMGIWAIKTLIYTQLCLLFGWTESMLRMDVSSRTFPHLVSLLATHISAIGEQLV